jgi:hypothetical protein
MSTLNSITADVITTQENSLFPVVGENLKSLNGNVWIPKAIAATKAKTSTMTLGATLLFVFVVLFLFSVFLVFQSMFVTIPGVSTKFAVFLSLLSGGFAGELLYARKLKHE